MILCNLLLHKAQDDGRLVIDPEPLPRLPTPGEKSPYGTHSVDLRLGSPISIPKEGPYQFDLTKNDLANFLLRNSEDIDLRDRGSYPLERGKFVLGITHERVALPILPGRKTCLAARIEGKSSRSRCGLLVHFTAPTVHPGWDGKLALEIINLGPATFVLTHRMFIAQLIVEEVSGLPAESLSQFQRQSKPSGEK